MDKPQTYVLIDESYSFTKQPSKEETEHQKKVTELIDAGISFIAVFRPDCDSVYPLNNSQPFHLQKNP